MIISVRNWVSRRTFVCSGRGAPRGVPIMSGELVLAVEDEPLLRLALAALLEDAGYRVLEAANAAQGIELLEAHAEIRFVITDINMPGSTDGLQLAHYVRGRWPPIHLIVVSGGGLPADRGPLPARTVFFTKPYRHDILLDTLSAMSERGQPR